MVEAAGIDPASLGAYLRDEAVAAAEYIQLRVQDFIDDDLVRAGHNRSLEGYKALMVENFQPTRIDLGGTIVYLPNYELYVAPSDAHAGLAPRINVFELLDEGREELPRKVTGAYPLWSNNAGGGKNVPTANQRVRGPRGRFITQFRAVNRFNSTTPNRPEPRGGPGNEPHLSRDALRGTKFFTKGPLPAVPGRKLYQRMLRSLQADLRRRGDLPVEVTLRGE